MGRYILRCGLIGDIGDVANLYYIHWLPDQASWKNRPGILPHCLGSKEKRTHSQEERYILSILKNAYREFKDRVDQLKSPRGAKTEQVGAAVKAFAGTFTLYELERACLEVSRDMVQKVLRDLQKAGFVECLGRGPGAVWQKKGNTLKKMQ
jgi:hypothetical protein